MSYTTTLSRRRTASVFRSLLNPIARYNYWLRESWPGTPMAAFAVSLSAAGRAVPLAELLGPKWGSLAVWCMGEVVRKTRPHAVRSEVPHVRCRRTQPECHGMFPCEVVRLHVSHAPSAAVFQNCVFCQYAAGSSWQRIPLKLLLMRTGLSGWSCSSGQGFVPKSYRDGTTADRRQIRFIAHKPN